jgi:hypothetical protein
MSFVMIFTISLQGTLDRTADLGILIRVFAGLDLKGEMVIWEFESIDKATGTYRHKLNLCSLLYVIVSDTKIE